MKIEKLTENKIRVIANLEELGLSNINVHGILARGMENQDIFLNILKRAEKELDFCTDGCKLLIEAFSSSDDVFVFTITKYLPEDSFNKKKLIAKRKSIDYNNKSFVCRFEDFDIFCHFCNALKSIHNFEATKLAKNISLYMWKNDYYLLLKNINLSYEYKNLFFSKLTEFTRCSSFSDNFEYKLSEHGKIVIRKNAINVAIDFFAN